MAEESGAALWTRLTSKKRPSLMSLSQEIIPKNCPVPKEIVEISGQSGTGKTLHLMELIAQTIIPTEFGGKGAEAIVIDTNSNFHLPNGLAKIIEKHILHHWMEQMKNSDTEVLRTATHDASGFVLEAMKRIVFFKCYDGDQLNLILTACRSILQANDKVGLIAIDSLTTFYWSDMAKCKKPIRMDTYLRNRLRDWKKVNDDFGTVLIYTKPSEFGSISTSQELGSYKIHLTRIKGESVFREARCYNPTRLISRCYAINDFGVQWMSSVDKKI